MQICKNIIFFNCIFKQTDQSNRFKPISLIQFYFLKIVKIKPNQTDEDFIASNIFLIEYQFKPNRYTPSYMLQLAANHDLSK